MNYSPNSNFAHFTCKNKFSVHFPNMFNKMFWKYNMKGEDNGSDQFHNSRKQYEIESWSNMDPWIIPEVRSGTLE